MVFFILNEDPHRQPAVLRLLMPMVYTLGLCMLKTHYESIVNSYGRCISWLQQGQA